MSDVLTFEIYSFVVKTSWYFGGGGTLETCRPGYLHNFREIG